MAKKHPTKLVPRAAIEPADRSRSRRAVSRPWKRRLEELALFKKKHGHCRVADSADDFPGLARWVVAQRYSRRQGKLCAEGVRRLNELGFSWDVAKQERWEAQYAALAAYRRAHGHCRVPLATRDNRGLAHWVSMQRHARRAGTLSAERVRKLDKLHFVWDGWAEQWEGMFAALVKYRKSHGNCDVPRGWWRDPKLADWVARQRKFARRGTLPCDRKKRLAALGFVFALQEAKAAGKRKAKSQPSSGTIFGPIGGGRRMLVVGTYVPG